MTEDARPAVGHLASRAPGEDGDDPYADVDLATLPDWWRRAIREFEAHDLRPYRPPRLADGTPVHEIVDDLEAELDVDVTFGRVGRDGQDWEVRVDGTVAGTVGRHRSPDGYTVYEVAPDSLAALVRDAV